MPRSTTDRALVVLIGALLVVFLFVVSDTLQQTVIAVGDAAPEFSIQTDSGLTMSPSNFGGRLLVLNFWASWCPPCLEEMPSLDQFQREFRDSGVVVLAISVDEEEAAYRRVLDRVQASFLTARDPVSKISTDFGTFRYPETYVIDANGKVVQKIVGPAVWTDERMGNYIKSLL